jgi:diguanylate cyclase (GGDEF)-like protein
MLLLGIAVSFVTLALGVATLIQSRDDDWRRAQQSSTNLALTLARDIARNLAVYDLSIQGAIEALQLPGLNQVSPEIRHSAIFDRAVGADYLGSMLVLDKAGVLIADSNPQGGAPASFTEQEYFSIHRDHDDAGLYVSRPFNSRLRASDPIIVISRRRTAIDGTFAGVVAGALRLAYFQSEFASIDVGAHGSLMLLRNDGRVVARTPYDPAMIDRDLRDFQQVAEDGSGQFVTVSKLDGVQRLVTYRRVGDLPLIVSVAISVDEIYADWRHKAMVIGPILVVLCAATIVLCLLFRNEMRRRLTAEAALRRAAEELTVTAATDSLTGLANRRAFDVELRREWRRAIRGQSSIGVLMLDADHFKQFNDRFGHQTGDHALQAIADVLGQAARRPADLAARYGGEEFVALVPGTNEAGALCVAERIRAAVAALAISHPDNPCGWVSVSIGVAVARPEPGSAPEELLQAADTALYAAKHAGRDCCVMAAESPAVPTLSGLPPQQADASGS